MIKSIYKDTSGGWCVETDTTVLPCHGEQDLVATLVFCITGYDYEKYLAEVVELLREQTNIQED